MKRIPLLVVSMMLCFVSLFGQVAEHKYSFGLFGNYSINSHSADFTKIPECPSCSPGYRDGSGSGVGLGVLFEYNFAPKTLFSVRASLQNLSGELIAKEATTVIVESVQTVGEFEHSMEADLSVFGIEPAVKYNAWKNLFVSAGLHIGSFTTKDYSQKEEISKPEGVGTFIDEFGNDTHSRIRNAFSGEIESASAIFIAPFIGVSYELPLNAKGSLVLEPELNFYLGLSNVVDDPIVEKWTVNSIRPGIALKYKMFDEKPLPVQYQKLYDIDTIQIESEFIASREFKLGKEQTASDSKKMDGYILNLDLVSRTDTVKVPKIFKIETDITAVGVSKEGNEIINPKLTIEEFVYNRLDPLLNYVFFDDNSSEIPKRYIRMDKEEANRFTISDLFNESTMEIYYNVLNIIGKRLSENDKAKITLIGCNSDIGAEKDNLTLSEKRAESVKNYLVNNCGIDPKRIAVKSKNLPDKPSTPTDDPDKLAENRRVEILSDDYKIIEPIYIENINRSVTPPIVRFKVSGMADREIGKWAVRAGQESNQSGYFEKETTGSLPASIDWLIEKEQKLVPGAEEPLVFMSKVWDKKGKYAESKPKTIPVELVTIREKRTNKVGDYEIEKYSLILFDFDKSNIAGNNTKIIDLIKNKIGKDGTVEIKGFTDRTGEADYNRSLSTQRATNVQKALARLDATTSGIGEDELLYDNSYPEGRFYCRTVDIIVKKEVK